MTEKKIEEMRPVIIGVDHGYGNIKTAHKVFLTGVDRSDEEPVVSRNFIRYRDKYYVIGENHMTYQGEKTDSDDFFILTLAAIAEELDVRGFCDANVILAAGLPLAWVSRQKNEFRKYLMQDIDPEFDFRGKHYRIHIGKVLIFPQGYAAVLHAGDMAGENMLVDIGNGTMNVMRIVDRKPIEKSVATEKYGVSICMREIRGELSRLYAEDVPESMIEPMLRSGCAGRHDQISEKIRSVATRYTEEIIRRLSIYGFREGLTKLYIIGGGGCLLKNYSDIGGKEGVVFIDDICANAKGFEYLAERKLELKGRR
jgi:plasmid segregation protein ParM